MAVDIRTGKVTHSIDDNDAPDEAEARGFVTPDYRSGEIDADERKPWHLKPWRTSLMPSVEEVKARLDKLESDYKAERRELREYLRLRERQAMRAEVQREKAGR